MSIIRNHTLFAVTFLFSLMSFVGSVARGATSAVTAGSTVVLAVTADGTAPFSYKWYKDGTVVNGATASSYSINNIQAGNAGAYNAVVSNSAGSASSSNVVITINGAAVTPVITTQPAGQAVTAGTIVTFAAAASGAPAPTLQWKLNGTAISGATSATLSIANAQSANAGIYTFVATNSAGSATSNGAALVVNPVVLAPVITAQPGSQTVTAGASVTFPAAASGTPAPTFQWKLNGTAISGATGTTLSIANAQSAAAGTYTFVATNSAGSATSNGATLTVNPVVIAPVITAQPASQQATAGTNVTFNAAASGTPAPTFQWMLNGIAISGATSATLSMANVQSANAGTYTLVAMNIAGSATSSSATLMIHGSVAPFITTQPAGQTVTAGASVTFNAVASGTPAPTFQWKLNGTAISGATSATLTISNSQSANAGTYMLVATNSAGSATTSGVTLTVNPAPFAPLITTQPFGQTVTAGASVTFTAAASGAPAPTFQWKLNGTAISGATSAALTIGNAQYANAGTYSLIATNSSGSVTSNGAVLSVTASSSPFKNQADFNGDTKSDIIWQNILTGEHSIWLMAGTNMISTVALSTEPKDWQIVATGDFNRDGKPDVLWENNVTGGFGLWLMNGSAFSQWIDLGLAPAGWMIDSAGDFNGDGNTDIIWENKTTHERTIQLMNGSTSGATISFGVYGADWRVAATGDFNGDGKLDILWENVAQSVFAVAVMNGTSYFSWVDLGAFPSDSRIGGAGDFNGDGKPDILWQNTKTGQCTVWLMDGTKVISTVSLGTVSPEWLMAN